MTIGVEGVPAEPPDADVIDEQFQQLKNRAQQLEQQVDRLGQMMRAAAVSQGGAVKEWLGDFRQIAIEIKEEQAQMQRLLQSMHALAAYALHQAEVAYTSGWQAAQGGSGEEEPPGGTPGGMPGTSSAGSSSDWMTAPIEGPDVPPQQSFRSSKMVQGIESAARSLGLWRHPRPGTAWGNISRSEWGVGSTYRPSGTAAPIQAATRNVVDAQVGGQLHRFMNGSLSRSVREGGGWGMQDLTIRHMF